MQKHRDVLGERHHEKHRLSASKTVAEDHEQKRRPEAAGGSKGGGFAAGPVREAHGEGKGGARLEGRRMFEAHPVPFEHLPAEGLKVVSHLVLDRRRLRPS